MGISSTRTSIYGPHAVPFIRPEQDRHQGSGYPVNVKQGLENLINSMSTATPPGAVLISRVHWDSTGLAGRHG